MQNILTVGTIYLNCLGGCSMDDSKSLQKSGCGSMDYRMNNNSGIIIGKWVDNSVVQGIVNFCDTEPMSKISCWCKKDIKHKDMPCQAIVMQYNKSMAGVDFADMLIALYHIPCETKRLSEDLLTSDWYGKSQCMDFVPTSCQSKSDSNKRSQDPFDILYWDIRSSDSCK